MSAHIDPEYQQLLAAWQKAEMIPNVDPAEWRVDRSGRVMRFKDYNCPTKYGWHAIHVTPRFQKPTDLQLEAVQYASTPKQRPKAV